MHRATLEVPHLMMGDAQMFFFPVFSPMPFMIPMVFWSTPMSFTYAPRIHMPLSGSVDQAISDDDTIRTVDGNSGSAQTNPSGMAQNAIPS